MLMLIAGAGRKAGKNEFANQLLSARNSALFQSALPQRLDRLNLADAYDIQEAVHALRSRSVAAYKVGLTNQAAQVALGADEPIVGRLAACDLRQSPAQIAVMQHLKIVEAEFVVQFGEDLRHSDSPYTLSEIGRAISYIYAGIEVCNSRFGPDDVPLPCLVADNGNADILVIGDRLDGLKPMELADMAVNLRRPGKPEVRGSGAKVLGNPLVSLTWLANWLRTRGEIMKRGLFVACGSCTGVTELELGESVVAEFGNMGEAAVKFIPRN